VYRGDGAAAAVHAAVTRSGPPGRAGRSRGALGGRWFGPHALHHTFATPTHPRGVDPVLVADLVGHAGPDILRVYTPTRRRRPRTHRGPLTTDA